MLFEAKARNHSKRLGFLFKEELMVSRQIAVIFRMSICDLLVCHLESSLVSFCLYDICLFSSFWAL